MLIANNPAPSKPFNPVGQELLSKKGIISGNAKFGFLE